MAPLSSQLAVGMLLALLIAAAAWKARALSISGALAAALLGTLIFGLGGMRWAVLLLVFFVSSSLLSRMFKARKRSAEEKFSKGSQRDAGQVLANGGIAGLFVLAHLAQPAANWPWLAFAGALAAANADTWATELGILARTAPRLITNGQVVERGTSGGITLTGTASALVGALLIAVLAVLVWPGEKAALTAGTFAWIIIITGLAGLAGSLLDSYLGATVQAIYRCPCCQKETERHPTHSCGCETQQARGWAWMNNDWVNTFCTLAGAVLAAAGAAALF